jgi:hypothetical protein
MNSSRAPIAAMFIAILALTVGHIIQAHDVDRLSAKAECARLRDEFLLDSIQTPPTTSRGVDQIEAIQRAWATWTC